MHKIDKIQRIRPAGIAHDDYKDETYELSSWDDIHNYDDKVIVHGSVYQVIFGRDRKEERFQYKKGIIKITNRLNKSVIYRQYFGHPQMEKNKCGLTAISMVELGAFEEEYDLVLSKTSKIQGRFFFFWDHPFIQVRVPMKIAISSFIAGFVAVLLAVLSIVLVLR